MKCKASRERVYQQDIDKNKQYSDITNNTEERSELEIGRSVD